VSRALASPWVRVAVVLAVAAGVVVLLWKHGPAWSAVADAFKFVRWELVAAAIGLNLLSVVVRAFAWKTVIDQAMPPPHPRFRDVFSGFGVGLFANAVLPGRVGELARVAVLTRKLPERAGGWAILIGTVFAHRVFDLVASMLLVVYVLATARIPEWARTSLSLVAAVGGVLLLVAILVARRHNLSVLDGLGPIRRLVEMGRHGLGVMREPVAATVAVVAQCLGWLCQLLAVYVAMRAFNIHAPLPAAGVVLVLMNVAILFPLWPGNVGLVQAAIALPLVGYGVAKAKGIAYGFGLQAIEASVGVGVGLVFLAREGLTFAMLRVMPDASQAEVPAADQRDEDEDAGAGRRSRARVSG
jgi:glycosyltransferase 2 family protein